MKTSTWQRLLLSILVVVVRSTEALLTAARPAARFERNASALRLFARTARGGVWRVFGGPDYLAFLVLIVLAMPGERALAAILLAAVTAALIAAVIAVSNTLPVAGRLLAMIVPAIVVILAIANMVGGRFLDQTC